jgi:transcriptional regulator with XRE-family HTH domain
MHAYNRFIQEQLDARGWTAAELSRRSGISEATLSRIIKDPDERLAGMPDEETIGKLARGFGIKPGVIVAHAATARYGVPVGEPVEIANAAGVSDDELIRQLEHRLHDRDGLAAAPALDVSGMSPESRIQIDELAQSLAEAADASEQRGHTDLAGVQRQMAAWIDAAITAATATPDQRRTRHRPQSAGPSRPTSH